MPATRVLVADAQLLTADSLARALSWQADLEVLDERPTNGVGAIAAAERRIPDVALVDNRFPDIDAPSLAARIRDRVPGCKLIFLSWYHGKGDVQQALASGASGFLPKTLSVGQVAEAVRRAHAGNGTVYEGELGELTRRLGVRAWRMAQIAQNLARLTPREREVLTLFGYCGDMREIAERLRVSPKTVKNHLHSIRQKTGARSYHEAVAWGRYAGLIGV
ncbi:MAG: response regulator [Actinomycetota bacterium]